jgi:hypothetical protein
MYDNLSNPPLFDDFTEEEIFDIENTRSSEEQAHFEELQTISRIMVSGSIDTVDSIHSLCPDCGKANSLHSTECETFWPQ